MEKKYIHYCWFGPKPLPKLAKKCIKSWKKYLPDWEIIKWDESNVDLNECPFIKEAYETKKWAFVADYARAKAMKQYGGVYFDTDMEIIKPIDDLMKDKAFIGVEDSGYIACGVWYESTSNSELSNFLLNKYQSMESFDPNNTYEFSIPKLITKYYSTIGYKNAMLSNQKLDDGTIIYTRDYFYPYSYNRQNNKFTENTCMIHYYDASWVPKGELKTIKTIRRFGPQKAQFIFNTKSRIKRIIRKTGKLCIYPVYKSRLNKKNKAFFEKRIQLFKKGLEKFDGKDYIAFCNKGWLGTMYATKENFEYVYPFHELYIGDNFDDYAKELLSHKFKLIIFSAFSMGWDDLVKAIRKYDKNVTIKVLWHGSNAMHGEDYDWFMFNSIFNLLNNKLIDSIGFAKESMYKYYKTKGYNVEFVMNSVTIDKTQLEFKDYKKGKNEVRIGLYASGNRWVKNFYNQFAGASLVKNSVVDCIPINDRVTKFAMLLNTKLDGSAKNIDRNELLERISHNDINLYCTFVECAPLFPLESFEMGVPCITGNNHHYWEGTELEKYLIVNKIDDSYEIAQRIEFCLKNKEKIMELYKKWKLDYDVKYKKNIEQFLNH